MIFPSNFKDHPILVHHDNNYLSTKIVLEIEYLDIFPIVDRIGKILSCI